MIVLKILAAPFVVALTLLVAIVSFLYCVASALCHIGCVVLTLLGGLIPSRKAAKSDPVAALRSE